LRTGKGARLGLTAGCLIAALSAGSSAQAQSKDELAKARELFLEGVALASGNNCAGALAKYKEVARVKMTPQVAFNIAECEERLGKLVSAVGNYRLAQSQLDDPKVRAKAKDVASQVEARITSLEERIPKLTIKRGKGAETATLALDGSDLGSAQVGQEMTVDPGPHELIAKIGEKEAAKKTFTIGEKETQEVEISVDLAALNKVDKPEETPKETIGPETPPVEADKGGSKVPGIVVMVVGAAFVGTGFGLFFGPRQSTINELEAVCGADKRCPPSAQETSDQGKLFTGLAEGAWGVGGAALITGVILLATSGGKKAPASSESSVSLPGTEGRVRWMGAAPGADAGGFSLTGTF
jgi:hypothetical protein